MNFEIFVCNADLTPQREKPFYWSKIFLALVEDELWLKFVLLLG
jgi:hypothetical protein